MRHPLAVLDAVVQHDDDGVRPGQARQPVAGPLGHRGEGRADRAGADHRQPLPLPTVRRVFARRCVDWTHRRPHLSGALPAALTTQFLARGWLLRGNGRALRVSDGYDRELAGWLGDRAGHLGDDVARASGGR